MIRLRGNNAHGSKAASKSGFTACCKKTTFQVNHFPAARNIVTDELLLFLELLELDNKMAWCTSPEWATECFSLQVTVIQVSH